MSKDPKKQEAKKMTPTQRLENLEKVVASHQNNLTIIDGRVDALMDAISAFQDALGHINDRITAVITASESGDINHNSVRQIIVNERADDLKNKLQFLIDKKILNSIETEIVNNCFVVGREIDKDGTVVNPRVQFALPSLEDDLKTPLLGKKVGDTIKVSEESDILLEITEVYEICKPEINKKFEEPEVVEEEVKEILSQEDVEAAATKALKTQGAPAPVSVEEVEEEVEQPKETE